MMIFKPPQTEPNWWECPVGILFTIGINVVFGVAGFLGVMAVCMLIWG